MVIIYLMLVLQLFIVAFASFLLLNQKNFFFFLLSAEMCFFSLGLLLIIQSEVFSNINAQVLAIMLITISACSSALGMILLLNAKQHFGSILIKDINNHNIKI